MRRRITAVLSVGIAAFLLLDLAVVLFLWPQLRRAEALSSRYAANSALVADMTSALQIIRSSATQHHVRLRSGSPPAESARPTLDEMADARRVLETAAADYEKTPGETETETWVELSRQVIPAFFRSVDEVLAPAVTGDPVDQASLDRLRVVANQAVALMQQLARLNAQGLDSTGRQMHVAVARLVSICLALGAVGAVGGLLFIRWALVAVKDYERSTSERIEELDQFAGRVAHDLRNPLQAIGMSLAVVHQRTTDERTRPMIEKAQGAARRMGTFIQELLQFARSGANPTPGASARVGEVMRNVEQDLAPGVAEKDVTVIVDSPEDLRAAISPDALRAIVGNLADNAVKHMPLNGAERLVDLRAERSGSEVRISVRDTGPGIAPDALPRLFEPFFRATSRPGGFGIGLKTVKRLVDAHGGRILVESEQGSGAEFTVFLPAAPDAGSTSAGAAIAAPRVHNV